MSTTTRGRYADRSTPATLRRWLPAAVGSLALFAVIALIAACSGTTAELEPTAETNPAPQPVAESFPPPDYATEEPEPTEETEASVGAIGDTATITQDWGDGAAEGTITVSALDVTTVPYDEYGEKPKHGHFLIFTVDVTAEGVFEVWEDDFYVRAADGTRYDVGDGNSWDAADYDDQLSYVELNAGEKKSGVILFDVPEPAGELAYAPNYDEGPIVTWAFGE